jgi:hypothetical protein
MFLAFSLSLVLNGKPGSQRDAELYDLLPLSHLPFFLYTNTTAFSNKRIWNGEWKKDINASLSHFPSSAQTHLAFSKYKAYRRMGQAVIED